MLPVVDIGVKGRSASESELDISYGTEVDIADRVEVKGVAEGKVRLQG